MPEQRRRIGVARELVDQRKREHVRQVTDQGINAVVVGGAHRGDAHAGEFPHRAHRRNGVGAGLGLGRHDQSVAVEKPGERGARPAFLGAGDRVRRHKPRERRTEIFARVRDHVALGAAGVGHDRLRCEMRCNLRQHRRGLAKRHRQQHEVRVLHRQRRIGRDFVDDAQAPRGQQIGAAAAYPDDPCNRLAFFQRERERAADQTDAENNELAHQWGAAACATAFCRARVLHAASDCRSASRKRSFSASRPVLTRRYSGIP